MFLTFNKIRKLNCSCEDIKKAISKSELIELSEDKDKICRKKPLVTKENVDDCTIYVENIKADADHDWLTQFFSDFGNVVYVSIPKYKHTKGNKGFAFVEFEKEIEAQNALSYFDSIGCKMPCDTNPEELVSIKTFSTEDTTEKTDNKRNIENKKSIKRKLSEQSEEEKSHKKVKTDSDEEVLKSEEMNEILQNEETESKKKKKHKKDKKKSYIRDLGLKILSKYLLNEMLLT